MSNFVTPYGYVTDHNDYLGIYTLGNGTVYTSYGNMYDVAYSDDIINKVKEYIQNKNGVWVNGQKKVNYTNVVVSDNNKEMIIFARINSNDTISRNSCMKLYYLKIYENDILIHEFIPVLDLNNKPALYDKVECKFYYNQGTGEDFIPGPEV